MDAIWGGVLDIGILDGVHMPQGKGRFSVFSPQLVWRAFLSVFFKQKCIWLVCEKWTIFPYTQYINGIVILLCTLMYFILCTLMRDRRWHLREICFKVTVISRRNHASLQCCRKVNIAIVMIGLPVAWNLHSIAIYNWMGLASKLGYFRLDHRKIQHIAGCILCMHRCPHWDTVSLGQFIIQK